MTRREAVAALMMSPFYFTLTPPDRKKLIQEFVTLHEQQERGLFSSWQETAAVSPHQYSQNVPSKFHSRS